MRVCRIAAESESDSENCVISSRRMSWRPPFSASDISKSINNEGRLIIYYDEEDREIKRMPKGRGRLPLGAFLDNLGNYVVKVGLNKFM